MVGSSWQGRTDRPSILVDVDRDFRSSQSEATAKAIGSPQLTGTAGRTPTGGRLPPSRPAVVTWISPAATPAVPRKLSLVAEIFFGVQAPLVVLLHQNEGGALKNVVVPGIRVVAACEPERLDPRRVRVLADDGHPFQC